MTTLLIAPVVSARLLVAIHLPHSSLLRHLFTTPTPNRHNPAILPLEYFSPK